MAKMYCKTAPGLRNAEVTVTIHDYEGTPQHFPLDKGLVSKAGSRQTIPVSVLQYNDARDLVLVSLPAEADSGAQRLWVDVEEIVPVKETAK